MYAPAPTRSQEKGSTILIETKLSKSLRDVEIKNVEPTYFTSRFFETFCIKNQRL